MIKDVSGSGCGRENDLVAFLYGELDDADLKSFLAHRAECAICREESAAFHSVRESIVDWRNETLGRSAVIAPAIAPYARSERKSALVAIRAFFEFSPLWMKGAVGFAAVLFFIFAGLAITRQNTNPSASQPSLPQLAQPEFNAMVEKGVEKELARREANRETAISSAAPASDQRNNAGSSPAFVKAVVANSRNRNPRRPLTKIEREQLAVDLRLLSPNDDRVGLLDDQINQ